MKLQLTQQIIITDQHKYYGGLDYLCKLAKNLYNTALYEIRQQYIKDKKYTNYYSLDRKLKETNNYDYNALPYRQSAQQVLRQVDKIFKSFFKSIKSEKNKGKHIRLPKYKDKNGRYVFTYTKQGIRFRDGFILLKGVNNELFEIRTDKKDIQQVRIVPKGNHIVVEIIYNVEYNIKEDNGRYAAIDLGINNIATLTSNVAQSIIYNGRPLKAINHFYNKKKALLQSAIQDKNQHTTKRIQLITNRRNRKVKDFMHKLSSTIINYMLSNTLNTLIVGKNDGWKNEVELGRVMNQNFVSIPYNILISMLEYKCKLHGINMVVVNEAYTSKCSFLDNETVSKHVTYLGKRVKRGLFISNTGIHINADVNGSLNILVLGLKTINVKRDVLVIEPANMRFVLNPVSISI